jgi:hypothetical protein
MSCVSFKKNSRCMRLNKSREGRDSRMAQNRGLSPLGATVGRAASARGAERSSRSTTLDSTLRPACVRACKRKGGEDG